MEALPQANLKRARRGEAIDIRPNDEIEPLALF
jgi:hypothetical protein